MHALKFYELENKTLKIITSNHGASIYQIFFKKDNNLIPILSTPKTFSDFKENNQSFGRTVGRTAGVIYKNIDTSKYIDFKNDLTIKHGGYNRVSEKYFDILSINKEKIQFTLNIKDNEDYYKGDLKIKITYEINNTDLIVKHEAISNKDTLCRLTFHPYFNFEQTNTLENHSLYINSELLLAQDEKGEFTKGIPISTKNHNYLNLRNLDINDNYNLDDIFLIKKDEIVCSLVSNNIKMDLKTNYPSLVVYTQNSESKHDLSNASKGTKYASIAIEAQLSQNELPLLKKDELYDYYTIYSFKSI